MKIEMVVLREMSDEGSDHYLSDSLFLPSPRDPLSYNVHV